MPPLPLAGSAAHCCLYARCGEPHRQQQRTKRGNGA